LNLYPGILLAASGFALALPSQGLVLHFLSNLTGGFSHC